MTRPTDRAILSPDEVQKLRTPEEARNFVIAMIEQVAEQIRLEPAPNTHLQDPQGYLKWERRLLMLHGQAMGSLLALQAFGHIEIAMFQQLKNKILGTMLRRAADVQLGRV